MKRILNFIKYNESIDEIDEIDDDDNWYNLFIDLTDPKLYDKLNHYFNLSKKLNIETHFYEFEEDEQYIIITVYLDKNTYDEYYNEYGDFSDGGNFSEGGDPEIKDIKQWIKAKKYNIL